MKIFLDVGAHYGETVKAVVDPGYGFDRIVCFEPATAALTRLRRLRDRRIEVCAFGLWNVTCMRSIVDPGSVGATIMTEDGSTAAGSEQIALVRATDWFRENISTDDDVYLKLNVEGAECDIIEDLLGSGELRRVRSMYVAFDVRKFDHLRHRVTQVKDALARVGFADYVEARDVMSGTTHVDRMQVWLDGAGARSPATTPMARARGRGRHLWYVGIPRSIRRTGMHRWLRALLPKRLYWRLRARVKGDGFVPSAGSSPANRGGTAQGHKR